MESSNKLNDILGRVTAPFKKLGETVSQNGDEDDLIHAVIQRIDVDGEVIETGATQPGKEETIRRLLRRMQWPIARSGVGAEELVRTYPGEVRALVVHKSYEKLKGERSDVLRTKFIELGLKNIQPGLWVLPPDRTPQDLTTQDELRVWLRREFTKPYGKKFDYVFPFVAVVDLKKVIAEKKGIRKMPTARTIYNVLEVNEVVPPTHLYETLKSRGYGVRDVLLKGDIPFLTSVFALEEEQLSIQEHADEILTRLRRATGSARVALEDLANIGPEVIAAAFEGVVAHPRDFAQRLIVEAQYWMRFLGGSVPGMKFVGGSATA